MKKQVHPDPKNHSIIETLWNVFCAASIVGIWPRFIEPYISSTTHLKLPIKDLSEDLIGLKIVQFSDLHLHPKVPDAFLKTLQKKILKLNPDIIVFTGDFLCFSEMQEESRMKSFFNGLKATYGCYAVLGNHDYGKFISINDAGEYDVVSKPTSTVLRSFRRFFKTAKLANNATEKVKEVKELQPLLDLIKETPFQLLNNESKQIKIKDSGLNIVGVGEYILGKCSPERAFKNYNLLYPGLVLAHNPDCFQLLKSYPGDLVLSGHAHGGQIYLPWIWRKFTLLEDISLFRGLHQRNGKWIYTTRGVGSVIAFRIGSIPEIVSITLEPAK
jgi:uncharacterized protein